MLQYIVSVNVKKFTKTNLNKVTLTQYKFAHSNSCHINQVNDVPLHITRPQNMYRYIVTHKLCTLLIYSLSVVLCCLYIYISTKHIQ